MSEDVSTFSQNYYDKAEKLGLKLEIYIGSEDFIGQLSLEMLFAEVNEKETIQTIQLESVEQAKEFVLHYVQNKI